MNRPLPKGINHAPARPAGGRAVDGLPTQGRRPGQSSPQSRQVSTQLNGVQGFALALFFPLFSGEKGAPPEA